MSLKGNFIVIKRIS